MKITKDDYNWLKEFIEPTVKEYAKNGLYLTSIKSQSEQRIAWDLFWFTPATKESGDFIVKIGNCGMNDNHLTTALISIKKEWFKKYEVK